MRAGQEASLMASHGENSILSWEMFASLFSFGSMLLGLGQTGYSKRRKKENQRKIGLMLGK